jgi:hypothetical protein
MRKVSILVVMTIVLAISLLPNVAQEALPDFIQHTECEQDLTGQEITIFHFVCLHHPTAFEGF